MTIIAKCDYCGRCGPLGACEGCGAPNEPMSLTHGVLGREPGVIISYNPPAISSSSWIPASRLRRTPC